MLCGGKLGGPANGNPGGLDLRCWRLDCWGLTGEKFALALGLVLLGVKLMFLGENSDWPVFPSSK